MEQFFFHLRKAYLTFILPTLKSTLIQLIVTHLFLNYKQ